MSLWWSDGWHSLDMAGENGEIHTSFVSPAEDRPALYAGEKPHAEQR